MSNFYLLEMNLYNSNNIDILNKLLKERISQSYNQYPDYFNDTANQTIKHVGKVT